MPLNHASATNLPRGPLAVHGGHYRVSVLLTRRSCAARVEDMVRHIATVACPDMLVHQPTQSRITRTYFLYKATAGTFVLYYEGYPTTTLLHDASEANVETALSAIPVIQGGVNVDFSIPSSGACNSTATNVIQVGLIISLRYCQTIY